MSEASSPGARQPQRSAHRQPSGSATERAPDLTLLALLEGLVAAQRMGAPLPLAAYARAYPRHTGALAAYAAERWSGAVAALACAPPRTRIPLSTGTQNALAQLFGGTGGTEDALMTSERLVAELPGEYVAGEVSAHEPPDGTDASEGGEGSA